MIDEQQEGVCPRHGEAKMEQGYGLCGGGIGVYWYCVADGCDWFIKEQDDEYAEPAKGGAA